MKQEYSIERVLIDLQSTDTSTVCNGLLGIAFCESDWQWAKNTFLQLLQNHPHSDIRDLCATCLGHVARIHGKLDKNKVTKVLKKYSHDPNFAVLAGAQNALDDIAMFIKP